MAYKIADEQLWDDLKAGILNEKNTPKRDIPKRLRVVRTQTEELSALLDLHGLTVQQAFVKTIQFLSRHYRAITKEVLIITGRGTTGQGLIKQEFSGWLNNSDTQKYVRTSSWQNRGGAIKITLKKNS